MHKQRSTAIETTTKTLTDALMGFAKPKTGKDWFSESIKKTLCQRVLLLIAEVKQHDKGGTEESGGMEEGDAEQEEDEEEDEDEGSKDEDNDEDNKDEDNDGDDGDEDVIEDEYFKGDLDLICQANCNCASAYQKILSWMWSMLSDEDHKTCGYNTKKFDGDPNQFVLLFV